MTDPAVELKAAVAELAPRHGTGPHLTEDEIAAYHAGTLPPDQEVRAQDHLLACPECTDLLLGREDLAGEGEPVPPGEMAAAWQSLRARLPSPTPQAQPIPAPLPFPAPRRTKPPVWLGALAASLLVAVVGLSLHVLSLNRTIDELSRPQAGTPVVDLFPTPLRSGREELPVVKLAPDVRVFLLVLNPTDAKPFPRYELEIARPGGEIVWRGAVRRNELGSFTLTLPRRLVGEGEYRLHLWGEDGEGREALGEYGLRVTVG